jgi:predicted AlkP superfamily phosphohydrolase/phosphomutase
MRPAGLAVLALVAGLLCGCGAERPPAAARTVVIGFDGLDPALTERWMDEGKLPHFDALRRSGHYQALATTNPPQSPVAWASFATGHEPGAHGIFDFLRRADGAYTPDFSIARLRAPEYAIPFFGYRFPIGDGELSNRRDGTPFWLAAEQQGQRASVFRVPVTYPPDPVSHMIAGMGVPDLLGSQGTYTLLATRPLPGADNGGRVLLAPVGEDGKVRTALPGPAHPLKPAAPPLSLALELHPAADGAVLLLDGAATPLKLGQWSPWIRLRFGMGLFGSIPGMARAYLAEGFPRPLLYISPLQADPAEPALPVSAPAGYAAALQARIGDFHTLGMPEETWALNQGHLSEQAWLELVKTTLAEGEAMLYDALDRRDSELVVETFVQTDRVSHMFWRGHDPTHPLHAESSELARGAVAWIYAEADRVLGEVQRRLGPQDRLIVLSDHGFGPFVRAAHVNRWLADQGYLVYKAGADPSHPLFEGVDWARSRAYALGLNGVYLNLQGREPQGSVAAADAAMLKKELMTALRSWQDPSAGAVLHEVYDAAAVYHGAHAGEAPDLLLGYAAGYRASWQTTLGAAPAQALEDNRQRWSGDHCVDPSLVPGVLFTSFKPQIPVQGMQDIAALALRAAATPATAP